MGVGFRITRSALENLRGTLVDCPACVNGFEVDPNLCGQDKRCTFCFGVKKISLIPCRCGRPLRLDGKGEVWNGVFCCGRQKCIDALKPTEEFADVVYTPIATRIFEYGGRDRDKENTDPWTFMGH